MLIKTKLRFGSILLASIPALLAGGIIGLFSSNHAEQAIEEQAQARLIALREERASQIENYFDSMTSQAQAYAKDDMILQAMR
ncbi:MAG: hypothetical protein KDI49_19520 [Gammaproteobacteria bacterium]|nr:hypothetical protein [Gammaproteobacteria bacterium]